MKIRFWGVRGSIACPGRETATFGGNTSCIELRFGINDRLVIIDSGTGIRPLGDYLVKNDLPNGAIDTEIFHTHTHWDHIIGFPFFSPIYIPGTKLKIYGPITFEEDTLEKIMGDLLRYRYFPVMHSELAADIKYFQLGECEMDLGDGIILKTKYLNHPLLCLGYRFEFDGKVFCTAFDTEPFQNLFSINQTSSRYDRIADEIGDEAAAEENEKLLNFFRGADILIHDCQYTEKEYYSSKTGWGHSFFEHAIDSAKAAEVKKVILFHHDPSRTDDELLELEKQYCHPANTHFSPEIIIAREGMELAL
ncbi:MAG: MBL fold metallo-hydrolase [Desulfobacterales bacterium]|nr:MAG: MBL fold metallo-hydrolase [Desulfobacterales bacterium]UCD89030.1 MAG: MBL fold metallo-hydrolase [Desulfobacterales bacterium]